MDASSQRKNAIPLTCIINKNNHNAQRAFDRLRGAVPRAVHGQVWIVSMPRPIQGVSIRFSPTSKTMEAVAVTLSKAMYLPGSILSHERTSPAFPPEIIMSAVFFQRAAHKRAAVVAILGTIIISHLVYTRRQSLRRHHQCHTRRVLLDPSRDPKTVELRQNVYSHDREHQSSSSSALSGGGYGYINLSCPYEMSKYSCSYIMEHLGEDASVIDGCRARETLDASTDYYLQNMDMIQSTFRLVSMQGRDQQPRRVFVTGDSLMRQLVIAIACNAMSSLPEKENLIEHSVFPWKDEWPSTNIPYLITGGQHSGFDAASIRLTNNLEIHFVPHMGFVDDDAAEHDVLERLRQDIIDYNGRITFGTKTAIPLPLDAHVDVLVYNDGMSIRATVFFFHECTQSSSSHMFTGIFDSFDLIFFYIAASYSTMLHKAFITSWKRIEHTSIISFTGYRSR